MSNPRPFVGSNAPTLETPYTLTERVNKWLI
jgi:hypothetical protein